MLIQSLVWTVGCYQIVPRNYAQRIEPGGTIEDHFLKMGLYKVARTDIDYSGKEEEVYAIWYPENIGELDRKFPLIIVNGGKGEKASLCESLFEHLASWGFIVAGMEQDLSWEASEAGMILKRMRQLHTVQECEYLSANPFYEKVDLERIGIYGHAQGGAGSINSIAGGENGAMYKAAFISSPAEPERVHFPEWEHDLSSISIPIVLCAGTDTAEKEQNCSLGKMRFMYDQIPSRIKVMMCRHENSHDEMLYAADGYMTAFFMWQLQDDQSAAGAFTGENAEILRNPAYQDVKKNF